MTLWAARRCPGGFAAQLAAMTACTACHDELPTLTPAAGIVASALQGGAREIPFKALAIGQAFCWSIGDSRKFVKGSERTFGDRDLQTFEASERELDYLVIPQLNLGNL